MVNKVQRIIPPTKFAEMAGVSRAAITKASKNKLKPAISDAGIDIDHPVAIEYIETQEAKRTLVPVKKVKKAKKPPRKKATKPKPSVKQKKVSSYDKKLEKYLDYTLREIRQEFGTDVQFKEYMSACKIIEEIKGKQISNAKQEGELILRKIVKQHIFGAIDNTNRQLLKDVPKTISRRLDAHIKSGGTLEEAENIVRNIISGQLKNLKGTAQRHLKK